MNATVCTCCGHMDASQSFRLGDLFVDRAGVAIWWQDHVVPLTAGERLLVMALAAAEGIPLGRLVLAEIIGSNECINPENVVAVLLSRINGKFHAIDPAFDRIENVRGQGVRWRHP